MERHLYTGVSIPKTTWNSHKILFTKEIEEEKHTLESTLEEIVSHFR